MASCVEYFIDIDTGIFSHYIPLYTNAKRHHHIQVVHYFASHIFALFPAYLLNFARARNLLYRLSRDSGHGLFQDGFSRGEVWEGGGGFPFYTYRRMVSRAREKGTAFLE